MMKLSTMWKVGSTVQEDDSSPVVEAILSNWDHDHGSAKWFRASANFIYRISCGGEWRFLRFVEEADRNREEIEEEVRLLNWLTDSGVRVAEPIQSRSGNYVETTATPAGTFHAVVFAELKGVQREIEDLTESDFHTWGAALGQLNAAMHGYKPDHSRRKGWEDLLTLVETVVSAEETGVLNELADIRGWMNALPVHPDNFGLIHFDFELDNLCWDDDTIGVLDFDDCSYDWYAADIAFALRDLFGNGVDPANPYFRSFVEGYRKHFAVDEEMLSQLPMFLRMHNLLMYAKLTRTLDVSADELPGWLKPLHNKLTDRTESYRLSMQR